MLEGRVLLSGDIDGSGAISGSLSGQYGAPGDTINFNSGVINGGVSGSFSATGNTQGYPPPAGSLSGSGSLSDGSTFIVSGGFSGPISNGMIQFSGNSSDGDKIAGSGTFSGTVDQNGNITSGSFSITTFTVTDQNADIWEPVSGGDYLWSDAKNWSLGVVPVNGAPATFDGAYDSQCSVDVNTSQGLLTLQNGYNATFTIQNNITLNINYFADNDVSADNFVVAFAGPNAVQNFTAGQNVMPNFNWQAGGKTTVNGANLTIGSKAGLKQSTASPVYINSGSVAIGPADATSGTSTFNLTNGSSDINVNPNGTLNFNMPTATAILVDNSGNAAWISNNGVVNLNNSPGGAKSGIIAVPLENHATLKATGGGSWNFTNADGNKNDIYMDAGKISLGGGILILCNHGYTQAGGTLEITDNNPDTLAAVVANGGASNFNGGKIVFDSATKYGTLNVFNAIFNGVEIDMRIDGKTNNANDKILCLDGNTCSIKGQSKLVVTAVNPVQKGSMLSWTLITPAKGQTIAGDFPPANITLPQNVIENLGALPNSWQCKSS